MHNANAFVLEVLKQRGALSMSVFEHGNFTSTLKHYTRQAVSTAQLSKLCSEVASLLNSSDIRGVLEPEALSGLKKTGQALYDCLLTKSVKERFKRAQNADLILSLDEELISVPWELLFTGEEFLCLKFNLGRVVRTKESMDSPHYRGLPGVPKMLILANPTSDLKSAYAEGLLIKNRLDRRRKEVSIDFKSTNIDNLYVKKNLRDYDIVHFAGHCEYDAQDNRNTGWILSDGKFTAQDIYTMAGASSLPSLVFSNACYSARTTLDASDIESHNRTYSLASAFLFSGVRHYIGAVRRIEDKISLGFAQEFYAQLISGKAVGECMRLSRWKLIKEYGMSAIPWTSYVLYGDPNFVLFRSGAKQAAKKPKKNLKKIFMPLGIASAAICMGIYLFMWLPSINPSAHYLFAKSRKLFLQGANEQVLVLANAVIQKDPKFTAIYPLLGDTYWRMGDVNNALKYYFEYALVCERKNDSRGLASAYLGIGWIYLLHGEYSKSLDFYNKALKLARKNNDKLNEARSLERLAVWHLDMQDNNLALEFLMKSSEINRAERNNRDHLYGLACDYFDIAIVFANKEDFATAKEYYAKSEKLFEKLKLEYELSDHYFNLGEISQFEKEYQKAMDLYAKGLEIDKKHGNRPALAADYNMIGELYVAMDNLNAAENMFDQAVLLSKAINARPELASAYYNLGLLYKQRQRKNKAREYLRLAQEIYAQIATPEYQKIKQEFVKLDNE